MQTLSSGLSRSQSTATISGKSAKGAARLFHYGNLLAVLIPFPIAIFWCGASMFVYAMNKHHPNHRVGYYTQRAATVFYAVAGLFIPVATFFPVDWRYYVGYWAFAAAVLIPWTIWNLLRIGREDWPDVPAPQNNRLGG